MNAVVENIAAARDRALETAIKDIEKSYGKGAVMRLDEGPIAEVDVISTGSIGIDKALVVGGIPRGRITEIYGPEMSGKTTLTLHLIAEAQKAGGKAAFIDAEHALDPAYAEKLGVKTSELLLSQPDHGEQALEIAERLVRSGAVDLVVIDSVAALIPKAELEADMEAAQMGLQARMMSKACRKLAGIVAQTNSSIVFINQIRMKIGVSFGSPEVTTGGNALKYWASVRLDIRRIGQLKTGDEVVGNRTRVTVKKNKVAPPFKKVEFNIIFGKGVWRPAELIDLGVEIGVVEKSGSWFSIGDVKIGQGHGNASQYLADHPEEAKRLEQTIRSVLFNEGVIPVDGAPDEESGESEGEGKEEATDGEA